MQKKLYTGITFFIDRQKTPVKLKSIGNLERHCKYIKNTYLDAHYTNYYDKAKRKYECRIYHITKEQLFTSLKFIPNATN